MDYTGGERKREAETMAISSPRGKGETREPEKKGRLIILGALCVPEEKRREKKQVTAISGFLQ